MPFGGTYSTLLLVSIGVVTLIYFAASKMFGHDRREPPLARQSIPFIGHMLGLFQSKFNYYVDLRYCSFYLSIQSCMIDLVDTMPASRQSLQSSPCRSRGKRCT